MSERILDHFETPVTHLRPAFFAEWFLYFSYMVKAGVVRFPFGTGKHAPISGKDQARVIAAILAKPEPHKGKIYPLYGAEEMTLEEMTKEIGRALGKDIRYEQIPLDEFAENAKANGRDMFTPFFIQHVREVAKDHQEGIFAGMNDLVKTIGGEPPTSIYDFALENRSALE